MKGAETGDVMWEEPKGKKNLDQAEVRTETDRAAIMIQGKRGGGVGGLVGWEFVGGGYTLCIYVHSLLLSSTSPLLLPSLTQRIH